MSRRGIPLRQIMQVVRKPRLRSVMEIQSLEVNRKSVIAVIDDLHRRTPIRILKRRNIERRATGNSGVDAVGARADELLAEVGVRPQAAGDADFGGAVDEHETLVVGRVGRAPPVEVAVGVADGEEVVDVVGPSDAVALEAVTAGVPCVVDWVKGRPLGLPDLNRWVQSQRSAQRPYGARFKYDVRVW